MGKEYLWLIRNFILTFIFKVQANIQVFGGNSNDVTIFGESAGAWSVGYHILSPLSKGLFKNAIFQSGSPCTDMTKNEALNNAKEYSVSLGCNNENWISCLKQLDPKSIYNYYFDFNHFWTSRLFFPVVGEAFLPVASNEAFKTGRFNTEINILAGITADEGSIFVFKWFDDIDSDEAKLNENVKEYLNKELKNWKHLESDDTRKKVIDYYISDETDVNMIKNKTGQIFADYCLNCPTFYTQRDIKLWPNDINIYMYKLTYKSTMSLSSLYASKEPWIGVGHVDDIEFVFGASLLYPERYSEQDYQFALLIMNLWSNFAKTG